MRLALRIIALSSALALLTTAQIVTGSISGTVTDPSSLPVAAVSVQLVEEQTGRQRSIQTNDRGEFSFPGLDAGVYTLTATGAGFKAARQTGIELTTGQRLTLAALRLEIGAVSETIAVTGQAPLLKPAAPNAPP